MTSEIVCFQRYWNSASGTPRCPLNKHVYITEAFQTFWSKPILIPEYGEHLSFFLLVANALKGYPSTWLQKLYASKAIGIVHLGPPDVPITNTCVHYRSISDFLVQTHFDPWICRFSVEPTSWTDDSWLFAALWPGQRSNSSNSSNSSIVLLPIQP